MAAASKFIDTRREAPRKRHDDAQVVYLRHAARSAGEAFAFEEEMSHPAPRSYASFAWSCVAFVATIALAAVYS